MAARSRTLTTRPAVMLVIGACMLAALGLSSRGRDDIRGRDAEPGYARVFNQRTVGRLDLQIDASEWAALMADMRDIAGPFGAGGGIGGSGRCIQTANGGPLACVQLGGGGGAGPQNPPAGGGGGAGGRDEVELLPRNPIYVLAKVTFDGETFQHVGFRLKGNSSLVTTWRAGNEKLPFRLNFDRLESRFPDIRDQTFFGFDNLSFSNNALDSSYLRAKVVTDLFRDAGLPAPTTAFMRVYLDRGAGSIYLGLYTMVEVPGRAMLNTLFGSNDGNLYKPHSTGGRWTVFIKDHFPKRTNENEDWTDIEDAIASLNASRVDRGLWRQRLEARFDVNEFLRWLALNTVVGNNDAYGGLSAHNYYLYGSPRHRDRLFWIPWDHDLAMGTQGAALGGGGQGGAGGASTTVNLFHTGIGNDWPLIRFLMDDPVYRATYRAHVEDVRATVFESSRVSAILQSEQARIAPYVIGAEGEQAARSFAGTPMQFDATVFGQNGLISYVQARIAAVRRALQVTP